MVTTALSAVRTSLVTPRVATATQGALVSATRSLVGNRTHARSMSMRVERQPASLASRALVIYKPPMRALMVHTQRETGFVLRGAVSEPKGSALRSPGQARRLAELRQAFKAATGELSGIRMALTPRREQAQRIIADFAHMQGFMDKSGRALHGDTVMKMFGNEKARASVPPEEQQRVTDLMKDLGMELQVVGFSDEAESAEIYSAIPRCARDIVASVRGSEDLAVHAEPIEGEAAKLLEMLDNRASMPLDQRVRGLYEQADRQLVPRLQLLSKQAIPVDRTISDRRVISQMSSDIRSLTRHAARQMDKPERMALAYMRDFLKDGNASGPTFHEMINKKINTQGATAVDALDSLTASAARPNRDVSEHLLGKAKGAGTNIE
ncbi:hypothetical protein SAMN05216567_109201 [Variovorax sp. OK605]|jgi:hypothetical protein|uniref:hypothetical protein n=1 Tax=Variovorax sp. OK605 TaxID=1855317 RepID=UPI0008EA84CD|nr:hypothetical protein [Variovorax sp. OK605]SFP86696.1 hypothetical protein SAMN05216567_109201 [Variovorax sp. OK605]